jgi:hypothetical protein
VGEELLEEELATGVFLGLGHGVCFEVFLRVRYGHSCYPVRGGFEVMADDSGAAGSLPPDMYQAMLD